MCRQEWCPPCQPSRAINSGKFDGGEGGQPMNPTTTTPQPPLIPTTTPQPTWIPYLTISLAAAAFAVAAIGLVFTIVKSYRIEGGRVVVSFDPGIWEPGMVLVRHRSKNGSIPGVERSDWMSPGNNDRGVECAIVEIENAGRVGVSVLEVGIEFKGKRLKPKFWKRVRGHIVPRTFRSKEHGVGTFDPPSKYIRLDPYSHAVHLMDVHTVIDAARKALPPRRSGEPRAVKLRASVKVAGRRRPARSRRRRQWRVPGTAVSLVNYSPKIRVESLIVLGLARQLNSKPNPDDDNSEIEHISRLFAGSLWDARDIADVSDRVRAAMEAEERVRTFFDEESNVFTVTYELGQVLRDRPEILDWTGAQKQSELRAQLRERRAELEEQRRQRDAERNEQTP